MALAGPAGVARLDGADFVPEVGLVCEHTIPEGLIELSLLLLLRNVESLFEAPVPVEVGIEALDVVIGNFRLETLHDSRALVRDRLLGGQRCLRHGLGKIVVLVLLLDMLQNALPPLADHLLDAT